MTETERELLSKIVAYGGYCTSEIISLYYKASIRHIRRILTGLTKEGYLRSHRDTAARNVFTLYQVTKKACIAFGRGDSHMRKKHEPPFRSRCLLRSHFLFSVAGEVQNGILSFPADKIKAFTDRGIPQDALPRKYNRGTPTIQIEETLLTAPPFAKDGGVCVVYADKKDQTAWPQLAKLFETYAGIVRRAQFPIGFHIVCEDRYKREGYTGAFDRTFAKHLNGIISFNVSSINREY